MTDTMAPESTVTRVSALVPSHELRAALQATLLSASKDVMLPVLCAVELTVDAHGITLTSTDRFRMTSARIDVLPSAIEGAAEWSALLSRDVVSQVVKAIPTRNASHHVTDLSFDGEQVTVRVNHGTMFTLRPLEGQFPRTSSLWPDESAPPNTGELVFSFNPAYLADFCKMPRDDTKRVEYSIRGKAAGTSGMLYATWDFGKASFRHLIMPVRVAS